MAHEDHNNEQPAKKQAASSDSNREERKKKREVKESQSLFSQSTQSHTERTNPGGFLNLSDRGKRSERGSKLGTIEAVNLSFEQGAGILFLFRNPRSNPLHVFAHQLAKVADYKGANNLMEYIAQSSQSVHNLYVGLKGRECAVVAQHRLENIARLEESNYCFCVRRRVFTNMCPRIKKALVLRSFNVQSHKQFPSSTYTLSLAMDF